MGKKDKSKEEIGFFGVGTYLIGISIMSIFFLLNILDASTCLGLSITFLPLGIFFLIKSRKGRKGVDNKKKIKMRGDQKKIKNKKPLPLWLSILAFIYVWIMFLLFSGMLFALVYSVILSPTGFTLFMLPIFGAVWFIVGFLMVTLASDVNKGFKGLKKGKKRG